MEGDVVQMQEIMRYHKKGVDADNRIIGEFKATGIRPRFLEKISEIGLSVDPRYFEPTFKL